MNENTRDLSQFGYREKDMAADLLKALSNGQGDFLDDGTTVEFNPNSGMVFLVDDNSNVGVMEDGKLVQYFSCWVCGAEGTAQELEEQDPNHRFHKFEANTGELTHIGEEE